jgi:hypothetical protein
LQTDTDVRSSKICDADQLVRVKVEVSDVQEEESPAPMPWRAITAEHEVSCMFVWPVKNVSLPPVNDESKDTGQRCRL